MLLVARMQIQLGFPKINHAFRLIEFILVIRSHASSQTLMPPSTCSMDYDALVTSHCIYSRVDSEHGLPYNH